MANGGGMITLDEDYIILDSDVNGYWDNELLHINISLRKDNSDWVNLKEIVITEDDLEKIERGESTEDLFIEGSRVFIQAETDDDNMVDSKTDIGLDISFLLDMANNLADMEASLSEPSDKESLWKKEYKEMEETISPMAFPENYSEDESEDEEEKSKPEKNPNPNTIKPPYVDDDKWNNAIKNAQNFNMTPPGKTYKVKLDLPSSGEPIAQIGKVSSIIYTSNKEGLGEEQQYIHEMKKPYPILALAGTNKKPVYIIFGGRTYISEPGDDSGEAPGWMID